MSSAWRPDIIIGIDFGMTCTGVAYSMGPDWPEPTTIQRWPGKLGHELRNKVDTAVSYDIQTGSLSSWGFLCSPEDESCEFNELFKLYLDPQYSDDPLDIIAPSLQQAQGWYRDYIRSLHTFLDRYFEETVPRYGSKRVEYVFSMPTTWKNPSLVATMERLIEAAGFGRKHNEKASMYLTEAEAAAVYTTKRMDKDDTFLVCDAGGGTTDLNVLKNTSASPAQLELKPLSWTEGTAVGSTLIDFKARRVLMNRLGPIKDEIPEDLENVISRLIDEDFRSFKCSFGVDGLDMPKSYLRIPGLQSGKNIPELGIENSKLVMTKAELQSIFDDQVDQMFGLIDRQLQIVQSSHAGEKISYLVLSGGLGGSPYVQRRARARYENGGNLRLPNARGLKVLLAAEPQLAVCHGLVIARKQEVRSGADVFTRKCSPVSYGFLVREMYDPAKHQGETVVQDFEGVKWATGQVDWIVKQGEAVAVNDGIRKKYGHRLELTESDRAQHATVMMSTLPPSQLPTNTKRRGVQKVCEIEYTVPRQNVKSKGAKWYSRKPKYYQVEYEVRAIIGAGLTFQIWEADGLQLSKSHHEIKVVWQPIDGQADVRMDLSSPEGDGEQLY